MTPHLSRLIEMVQIRGHNICFYAELKKLSLIITKYSLLSRTLNNNGKVKVKKTHKNMKRTNNGIVHNISNPSL